MSLDAQLARIQRNLEAKSKNTNTEASKEEGARDLIENTVTKSNALARAYYRLSLTEKRVMESLISKLHPMRADNELQHLELLATEYVKAFPDAGNHAYDHLKSAGESLIHRVIIIERPDSDADREELTLMARVRYQKKQGRITCTFNPLIVPHLIGLRQKFTSYPLKQAVDFSSSYTWRFYELLMSWTQPKQDTGGLLAGWINQQPIDDLREMLGVPESYRWDNFQRQVLNVATKELREKANIAVFLEPLKTSRKYTHINIKFIEDNQLQMKLEGGEAPTKKRGRKPKTA